MTMSYNQSFHFKRDYLEYLRNYFYTRESRCFVSLQIQAKFTFRSWGISCGRNCLLGLIWRQSDWDWWLGTRSCCNFMAGMFLVVIRRFLFLLYGSAPALPRPLYDIHRTRDSRYNRTFVFLPGEKLNKIGTPFVIIQKNFNFFPRWTGDRSRSTYLFPSSSAQRRWWSIHCILKLNFTPCFLMLLAWWSVVVWINPINWISTVFSVPVASHVVRVSGRWRIRYLWALFLWNRFR